MDATQERQDRRAIRKQRAGDQWSRRGIQKGHRTCESNERNNTKPTQPCGARGDCCLREYGQLSLLQSLNRVNCTLLLEFSILLANDKIKAIGFSSDVVDTFSSEVIHSTVERIAPTPGSRFAWRSDEAALYFRAGGPLSAQLMRITKGCAS
jgi:hypothetical protein